MWQFYKIPINALINNKMRAFLTILGLVIGVYAVIVLVAAGTGAKRFIVSQFEGLGSNLIAVQPGRSDVRSGFTPTIGSTQRKLRIGDVEALKRRGRHIESVTGLMFGTATLRYQGRSTNVNLMGVNDQFIHMFNMVLRSGQYFGKDQARFGRRVVVLGASVAKRLFEDQAPVGRAVKVNQATYRVIGVIARAGQVIGFNLDEIVHVPTRSAMRIFNDDALFGIRVKARSKSGLADTQAEIIEILKKRHHGHEDFTLDTQESMMDTLATILDMLTYMLMAIALISIVVGGVGIMNIMLVSVTERTREIGIRRAVGARRSDILKQFIAEAVILSATGGTVGIVLAYATCYTVNVFTSGFDMTPPLWVLLPATGISLGVGVGFGVWPALKAARTETITALRAQ